MYKYRVIVVLDIFAENADCAEEITELGVNALLKPEIISMEEFQIVG